MVFGTKKLKMQRRGTVKCNATRVERYHPYAKKASGSAPPPPTNENKIEDAWLFLEFLQKFKLANPRKSISQVMHKGIVHWVALDTYFRQFYVDTIKNMQKRKVCKKREQRKKRKSAACGKPVKVKAPTMKKKKCMAACCNPKKVQPKAKSICPKKIKDAEYIGCDQSSTCLRDYLYI